MIWVFFACFFLIGVVAGMITGKILTEVEMLDYAEERYQAGCEAGYDDGYADAIHDAEIGECPDEPA